MTGRQSIDTYYIESKMWKCDESPTGAHYWLLNDHMFCIHCKETKEIPEPITVHQAKGRAMVEMRRRQKKCQR